MIGDAHYVSRFNAPDDLPTSWTSNDFFASDYVIGRDSRVAGFTTGNRIISYRGTDLLGADVFNYGIGAGDPYNATRTSYGVTTGLAVNFYQSVVGSAPFELR
jgi:hypothetical protein